MASAGKSQGVVPAQTCSARSITDGDGAISRLESDASIAQMAQQGQPQGPPPPKAGGVGRGTALRQLKRKKPAGTTQRSPGIPAIRKPPRTY
jgi:hypothetical protein